MLHSIRVWENIRIVTAASKLVTAAELCLYQQTRLFIYIILVIFNPRSKFTICRFAAWAITNKSTKFVALYFVTLNKLFSKNKKQTQ